MIIVDRGERKLMSLAIRLLFVVVLCAGSLLAMHGSLNEDCAAKSPYSVLFSSPHETPVHEDRGDDAKLASGGSELDLCLDKILLSHRLLLLRSVLTRPCSRRDSTQSVQIRNGAPFSTGPPGAGLVHSA